jgi:quinone-modifying oxidoreductase, subunit QmoB
VKERVLESVFLSRPPRRESRDNKVLVLGGDGIGLRLAEHLGSEGWSVMLVDAGRPEAPHPNVSVVGDARLETVHGFIHGFDVGLRTPNGIISQQVGFIVAAQPALLVPKYEYYGISGSQVTVTLSELERKLTAGESIAPQRSGWLHVAFLCGLEGDSDPSVFARVLGCVEKINGKEQIQSYVFTRQVKVAAQGLERRYRLARESGALFFKFDGSGPVFEDTPTGPLMVFTDPLLGQEMELLPDLLVVDEHVLPPAALGPLLDAIPSSAISAPFLQPESVRFSGVSTQKKGILAVGPSRGVFDPDLIESDIAAVSVALVNSALDSELRGLPGPPEVDPAKCTLCLTCVRLCPHGAITFGKKAEPDPASCVRCGICAVECPMEAIKLPPGPGDTDLENRIGAGLAAAEGPRKIVGLLCARSAAQALGAIRAELLHDLVPVVVPCAGTVDQAHLLLALQAGADGVMVAGCFSGNCASIYGTVLAAERSAQAGTMLREAGLCPDVVKFVPLAANTPAVLVAALNDLRKVVDRERGEASSSE